MGDPQVSATTGGVPPPPEVFEQNIAIMLKRDPELAARMTSDIDCSHIEVMPSHQPGVLTAEVTLPSGEKVLLHNMEDPIGSARRTAENLIPKAENGSILLGFALGYLAIELEKKLEKHHPILMCEQDPAVLKTALTYIDLSNVLNSDHIRIFVGPDIPLQDWIWKLAVKFMTAKVDVISYSPSVRMHGEAYEQLSQIAQKESRAIILNRNTTVKAGRQMAENMLRNFPDVLESAGVRNLEGLFQGYPAVLVAAGPSLEKNMHLLRELKGRAVIISVDTALRLLLPLGIKPDIVTNIDFNPINSRKFTNVRIDPDISLVYYPGGHPEGIQTFTGPRFTVSQVPNRIPAWLMHYVGEKGGLPSGTTVAHMSFHLARHMGCDPIVFIGQDLAFPENRIHAANLSLWDVADQEPDMIEDIFGEQVGTMASFKHAIYYFEKIIKETKAMVIDATEGGAKKQGAKVMRLRDVIDEYCQAAPIDIKGMLRNASEHVEPTRMDELVRDMDAMSQDLDLIRKDCRRIRGVVTRLDKMIAAGNTENDQFAKLTTVAEKITQDMDGRGRALHLMGEQNYALELYMMQHAVATIDDIEDEQDKITQQVARAKVFYPSVAVATAFFKPRLARLVHRLKAARRLELHPLGQTARAEDWYQRALAFQKIDYRRDAIQCAQEALEPDPKHGQALTLLTRLYLDQNRVEEALLLLNRLTQLHQSTRALTTLRKEAHQKQRAWKECCARLETEFQRTATEGSLEEAGWFYYRTQDHRRAVTKLERAVAHEPTAQAYARLGHARYELDDVEGAVSAWESAIALAPKSPSLFKDLGLLALRRGLTDHAEQFLAQAVRLNPDDWESSEGLAGLYVQRGAYVEAGQCYENVLRLDPSRQELIFQIAALYQRQIQLATTQ